MFQSSKVAIICFSPSSSSETSFSEVTMITIGVIGCTIPHYCPSVIVMSITDYPATWRGVTIRTTGICNISIANEDMTHWARITRRVAYIIFCCYLLAASNRSRNTTSDNVTRRVVTPLWMIQYPWSNGLARKWLRISDGLIVKFYLPPLFLLLFARSLSSHQPSILQINWSWESQSSTPRAVNISCVI